jgi:hypothetical protein
MAGSVSPFGGASIATITRAEAGGDATFHVYVQGTHGVAATADVGGAGSTSGGSVHGGLGVGYAAVPTPFTTPWGYELTARAGAANVTGHSQAAVYAGARIALLFRPGQSDTIWHQDRSPTTLTWLVGPLLIVDPTLPTTGRNPWVDTAAGIAIYGLHYDIGAP